MLIICLNVVNFAAFLNFKEISQRSAAVITFLLFVAFQHPCIIEIKHHSQEDHTSATGKA
jgi:hypothetical protein